MVPRLSVDPDTEWYEEVLVAIAVHVGELDGHRVREDGLILLVIGVSDGLDELVLGVDVDVRDDAESRRSVAL